jgi:cell division protease FtsH
MTKQRGAAAPSDWIEVHRIDAVAADLDDVIGLNAAKREMVALAARLTKPRAEAPIPRGVLLWGPPGCGKTLLARVFTNLLGGPDGSTLMYAFGASELLERGAFARIGAALGDRGERAVVFVDEVDLFARGRDDYRHTNETRRALYAALNVLDGLKGRDDLLWLWATSRRPAVLDEALLRPGRMDVHVEVGYPDQTERERLLSRLVGKLHVVGDLDLRRAAAMLGHQKSPAAVTAIVQDAFALAMSDGRVGLHWAHLAEAIQRDGHVADDDESDEVRWRTAVHEAGHAVVARLLGQPVTNVTILARHGRTDLEEMRATRQTRSDMVLGRVVTVRLAGLAAETVVFGDASAGSETDISSATAVALGRLDAGLDPVLGPVAWRSVETSTVAANGAFTLVQRYLRQRLTEAQRLVSTHEAAVRHFAQTLLGEQQLSGERLAAALATALASAPSPERHAAEAAIASDYTDGHESSMLMKAEGGR